MWEKEVMENMSEMQLEIASATTKEASRRLAMARVLSTMFNNVAMASVAYETSSEMVIQSSVSIYGSFSERMRLLKNELVLRNLSRRSFQRFGREASILCAHVQGR